MTTILEKSHKLRLTKIFSDKASFWNSDVGT